jgi:hypothetical protein
MAQALSPTLGERVRHLRRTAAYRRAPQVGAPSETPMSGHLPMTIGVFAVLRYRHPELDERGVHRLLHRLLPMARGLARFAGIDVAALTVGHFVLAVHKDSFHVAADVEEYLRSLDAQGVPRFKPTTRRVYVQHLKRFAWLVYQARGDHGARRTEEWAALVTALGPRRVMPHRLYQPAWSLFAARCRARGLDPLATPDRAEAMRDYAAYLQHWGYPLGTARHYRWIIRSLLAQLGQTEPPLAPLGPWETQIEELMARIRAHYSDSLEPETFRATKRQLRMFARFVLQHWPSAAEERTTHAALPPAPPHSS